MNNLSFISNNVKGLQVISKRVKIFDYLKNYVTSNGVIFLQETHPSVKDDLLLDHTILLVLFKDD